MSISMTVQGLDVLTEEMKAQEKKFVKKLRAGLGRGGALLLRESLQIVPIDKHFLERSGETHLEGVGFNSAAVVSYSTAYAIYVHEDLNARHKPGRTAKYLETPLRTKRKPIQQSVLSGMESVS